MKFNETITVNGIITCLTGLHIGGTKETVGIGETDNPIIRHPVNRLPYIPGSSLKGKIRSLLESKYSEKSQRTGRPCDCGACEICSMFGHSNTKVGQEPSRLIFRDAPLTEEDVEKLSEALPGSFVEVKSEIGMDRNTGTVNRWGPRPVERVPEGTEFDFEMVIRLFEEDEPRKKDYFKILADGFKMLENDYLGGCGTRGYGKVQIIQFDDEGKEQPMSDYFKRLVNQ